MPTQDASDDTDSTGGGIRRYAVLGVVGVLALVLFLLLLFHTGLFPVTGGDYEQRTLEVTDCAGTERGVLTVDIAESFGQQYVGLSRTGSLAADRGMLFTYGEVGEREIVMRNMDFALDVLYIGADGEITEIETLDAPRGPVEYYLTYGSTTGTGQYVLEVNAGWSETHGVSAGDCVTGLP